MPNLSKHAFGAKSNIEKAKADGQIDSFDIIFTDDGDIAWVDEHGNTIFHTSKTQERHTVHGVEVPAGSSIDDLIRLFAGHATPSAYEYAVQGGYAGSEADFASDLAALLSLPRAEGVSF